MDLWWSEHGRRLRSHTIRRFMDKHLRAELGQLPLSQVGDLLESVLNAKVGALVLTRTPDSGAEPDLAQTA